MTRRLVASYLLLTALILIVLEVPLGVTFTRLQRTDLLGRVSVDAATLAGLVEEDIDAGHPERLQPLAMQYRTHSRDGRLLVINTAGTVLADSEGSPGATNAAESRPEIVAALSGNKTTGTRHSSTLGSDLIFVAQPVRQNDAVVAAVRITYPSSVADRAVRRTWLLLAGVAALVLLAVGLLGLWIARAATGPLAALRGAAVRLGSGDLSARAPVPANPPEIADLAHSFNETADRLEELVNREREFAADVSHQLRTPLSVVRMRLELLDGKVLADAQEDLDAATSEVDRLGTVVEDLLLLARAESFSEPVAVELAALVSDRIAMWGPVAEEFGVTLAADPDLDLTVMAVPGTVEHVLDNLITNAVEACPSGGTVRLASQAGALHVIDDGPGMSETERAQAFDRSWRRERGPSRLGGSGLGLAIVRRLVTASGGTVRLDAADGGGIDASVRWPLPPTSR